MVERSTGRGHLMAERRMISKRIIDTDKFLDMPMTSRLLYYDLLLRADDDGFVSSPRRITRTIGASDDDLRLLIGKNYIIPFDSGICVIKDWKIHNWIRGDRHTDTPYTEEASLLTTDKNKAYRLKSETELKESEQLQPDVMPNVIPTDSRSDTTSIGQYRLGKESIGKYSPEEFSPRLVCHDSTSFQRGKVESSNTYDTDTILSLFQEKFKETFGHDYRTLSTAELGKVKAKLKERNVTENDINTYFDRKFYGTGNSDVNHFLCEGTFKLCREAEQEPPHKGYEPESTVGKGEYLTDEPIVIGAPADPEKVSKARSILREKQEQWQKFTPSIIVQPDRDEKEEADAINTSRKRISFFANAGEKELNDPKNQAEYGKEFCEISLHTLQKEQQTTRSAEI